MRTVLLLNNLFLILAVFQGNGNAAALKATGPASEPRGLEEKAAPLNPRVTLRSATEATITFQTEQNKKIALPQAEEKEIPHLVLNRNGVPTPGFERTLIVSMEDIEVPPSGAYAYLTIESQHGDPDLGGGKTNRIRVWEEAMFVPYDGETGQPASVDFRIVFQRTTRLNQAEIRTPTDYFRYTLRLADRQGNALSEFSDEYAFLMENQWTVPLPPILEATPGAAPDELVIYFYDMIPFQTDLRDPYTQIARQDVQRYIQTELVPAMVEAIETQTNLWGLPWYEEWTNYRPDEEPKSLSVALAENRTWYHGAAPSLGHAMISIRVDGSFGEYSDLTEGIMSVFHHELFHNQQRNISLHFGSRGNLHGLDEAWKVVSEGTAVLASAVGQPLVQFEQTARLRSYLKRANAFIGAEGVFGGGLNKSYTEIPYHTALYWRFLYEKCGGLKDGIEDPASGMHIIRNVLETLYKGEIVNINESSNVAAALPRILNIALQATPGCAFQTYEESLIHFARAIHGLRLADGRCMAMIPSTDCGLYDPHKLYTAPHAEQFAAGEGSTLINGSVPSSYGIDLAELALDPALDGKSMKIIFQATSTVQDLFYVELHGIQMYASEIAIERSSSPAGLLRSGRTANGHLVLELAGLNLSEYNALALTVLRLDPYETMENSGHYAIQVLIE